MSAVGASLSRIQTVRAEPGRAIYLADNTSAADEELFSDAELDDILPNILRKTPSWANPARVREELQKRKYAKYSEGRYIRGATGDSALDPSSATRDAPAIDQDAIFNALARVGTFADGGLRRGQQKLQDIMGRRNRVKGDADTLDVEIDVLYENQRGSWLFGQPLFSSKSLLNFDPSAWTTAAGTRSAVNIANAQLPDPSWQWVWQSWYVDMSLDVDEQGWQYNFMFNNNIAWHGVHPWFHSFVRRRRWIRKRIRTCAASSFAHGDEPVSKNRAHTQKLNADYFSICAPAGLKNKGNATHDLAANEVFSSRNDFDNSRQTAGGSEVDDMQSLNVKLKQATMDREKIRYVLEYMEHGREDTHYLADEIPHIMSTFIFQHSRRQLLASMLHFLDQRDPSQDNERPNSGGKGKANEVQPIHSHDLGDREMEDTSDYERQKHTNLVRAVQVADMQIKSLEYWSDVCEMKEEGQSLGTAGVIAGQ